MNKLAVAVLLFSALVFGYNASAQRKDSGYDVGTFLINGGLSFGNYYNSYNTSFVGITGNAEWSVHEWVSVGPYVGINPLSYGSVVSFGGRGSFHYTQFIPAIDTKMLDLYGTLNIGARIVNYDHDLIDDNYVEAFVGPVAGARWFPTKGAFALYGEVGYGPTGFLTLGVSGRF